MSHGIYERQIINKYNEIGAKTHNVINGTLDVLWRGIEDAKEIKMAKENAQVLQASEYLIDRKNTELQNAYKTDGEFTDDGWFDEKFKDYSDYLKEYEDSGHTLTEGEKKKLDARMGEYNTSALATWNNLRDVKNLNTLTKNVSGALDMAVNNTDELNPLIRDEQVKRINRSVNSSGFSLLGDSGSLLLTEKREQSATNTLSDKIKDEVFRSGSFNDKGEFVGTTTFSDAYDKALQYFIDGTTSDNANKIKDLSVQDKENIDSDDKFQRQEKDFSLNAYYTELKGNKEAKESIIQMAEKKYNQKIKTIQEECQNLNTSVGIDIQTLYQDAVSKGVELPIRVEKDKDGNLTINDSLGIGALYDEQRERIKNITSGNKNQEKIQINDLNEKVYKTISNSQTAELFKIANTNTKDKNAKPYEIEKGRIKALEDVVNGMYGAEQYTANYTLNLVKSGSIPLSDFESVYTECARTPNADFTNIKLALYDKIKANWTKDKLKLWADDVCKSKGATEEFTNEVLKICDSADKFGVYKDEYDTFQKELLNKLGDSSLLIKDGNKKVLPASMQLTIENGYFNAMLENPKAYATQEERQKLQTKIINEIIKLNEQDTSKVFKSFNKDAKSEFLESPKSYALVSSIQSSPLFSSPASKIADSLMLNDKKGNKSELYKDLADTDVILDSASLINYNGTNYKDLSVWDKYLVQCGCAIYRLNALDSKKINELFSSMGLDYKVDERIVDKSGTPRNVIYRDNDIVAMITPLASRVYKGQDTSTIKDNVNENVKKVTSGYYNSTYSLTFAKIKNGNIDWDTASDGNWTNASGEYLFDLTSTRQGKDLKVDNGKKTEIKTLINDGMNAYKLRMGL